MADRATLRNRAQYLYDVAGSAVLQADEWNELLNGSYRRLWAKVTGINKNFRVNVDSFTLTTTQTRALPADYRETFAVYSEFGTESETRLTRLGLSIARQSFQRSYRLQGSNLYIEPLQRCAGNYSHLYIPTCPVMDDDADSTDAELAQFDDWITFDTANIALTREESEQLYSVQQADEEKNVVRWASNQRSAEPDVVDDVRRRSWLWRGGPL